jgi:RimJ/RimL family protein N-acetyltransferase
MSGMSDISDMALMTLHCTTLFCLDATGRLRTVNEPGAPNPPRFWMGRTLAGNQWAFHHTLPAATVAALDELCQAEPVPTDLRRPPQHRAAIKALLAEHAPLTSEYRGPAYWVPETVAPTAPAVLIDDSTIGLLQPHFPWATATDPYYRMGPLAATIVDGQAVSVCFCSRVPGQATEAGLETLAAHRGRGYAGAAVATWAAAVYGQGCLPLYSTDWENLASQAVARKLGLVCYGEDWSLG